MRLPDWESSPCTGDPHVFCSTVTLRQHLDFGGGIGIRFCDCSVICDGTRPRCCDRYLPTGGASIARVRTRSRRVTNAPLPTRRADERNRDFAEEPRSFPR
jgi:hypothetical protein